MTEQIAAGDIAVPIPNAGKVLFPDDGITKGDLARYYADAAARMLPWLRDRPVTMMRYPDGLKGQRIVQKNVPAYFPDWIRRVEVPKEGGEVAQAVCGKPADLVYLPGERLAACSGARTPIVNPASGSAWFGVGWAAASMWKTQTS